MSVRERTLAWDGCLNVRDLGGHATEDGGETRYGAVVRADSVRALTGAGWQALVDYGITRIVDLRQHSELAADPPFELPVELVHVAVAPEPGSPEWDEIEAGSESAADRVGAVRFVYGQLLERRRAAFAAALGAVAQAPPGGVVVHCAAGKDRTGLVVALLLRLAGVAVDEIAADYAVSERNLAPLWQSWIEEADDEMERERRRRLTMCHPEVIAGVLDDLEREHGSVRAYAAAGGVRDAELDLLVAKLRG